MARIVPNSRGPSRCDCTLIDEVCLSVCVPELLDETLAPPTTRQDSVEWQLCGAKTNTLNGNILSEYTCTTEFVHAIQPNRVNEEWKRSRALFWMAVKHPLVCINMFVPSFKAQRPQSSAKAFKRVHGVLCCCHIVCESNKGRSCKQHSYEYC